MNVWSLMTVSSSMPKQPDVRLPNSADRLAELALATGDIYCAAAVHRVAGSSLKAQLEALMFARRRDVLLLARWEHTPASVLQAMCDNTDVSVQLRLLRNPNTSGQDLIRHSQQPQAATLIGLISQHPQAPEILLRQIAVVDEDDEHLKSVCRNQAADATVLQVLLARKPEQLDRDIIANSSADAGMLQAIYARGDMFVKAAVLGHQNCPLSLVLQAISALTGEDENEILLLRQLAKDSRLNPGQLQAFRQHSDAAVRAGLVANPTYPADKLDVFVQDTSPAVRRALAAREDLSADLMQQLSRDTDDWVRQWLGRNASLPQELMWQLAEDPEADVRRAVARNKNVSAGLMLKLLQDPVGWVRAAVAYQPNAGRELLMQLVRDEDIDVLSGVAANANTPATILKRLAQHAEADVRRGVIHNPSAKREVLLPLLEDPYYLHRLLLMGNRKLTEADKWPLYEDPDYRVRFAVFKWFADRLGGV